MKMLNVPAGCNWGVSYLVVLDNDTSFNDVSWYKTQEEAKNSAAAVMQSITNAMKAAYGDDDDTGPVVQFAHTVLDANHIVALNYEIYQIFEKGNDAGCDGGCCNCDHDCDKQSHTIPDAQCVRDDEDDEDNSDTSAKPQEYCTRGALGADDSSDDD